MRRQDAKDMLPGPESSHPIGQTKFFYRMPLSLQLFSGMFKGLGLLTDLLLECAESALHLSHSILEPLMQTVIPPPDKDHSHTCQNGDRPWQGRPGQSTGGSGPTQSGNTHNANGP